MSIWFFLWLFLSLGLIYFMAWTGFILVRQKRAWQAFALQKNLRYRAASMMASPEMNGSYEGYPVSLFTGEHGGEDSRGTRKLTAVEVKLQSVMPFEGGVASGDMVQIIRGLSLRDEFVPGIEGWDKEYIIMGDHRAGLETYFDEARLKALLSLLRMKNVWVIFIFRSEMTLLRIDTPHPLDSLKALEKIMSKMVQAARVLELKPGESAQIKSEMVKRPVKEVALALDEEKQVAASGLQLEEDEAAPEIPQTPDQDPHS